jgi:hypothetical protein
MEAAAPPGRSGLSRKIGSAARRSQSTGEHADGGVPPVWLYSSIQAATRAPGLGAAGEPVPG